MSRTLIWCHGGCFSGGSIEYDKELREFLIDNNICKVIPVNFSLHSWNEALLDITWAVDTFCGTVILGGVSSGALLAHAAANCLKLPAILICPVIKPATRHTSLPKDLQAKQLAFFQDIEYMQFIEDSITPPNNARYILYGKKDDRAPSSAFQSWLELNNVVSDALDQGHEICNKPPCELIGKRLSALFASKK